MTEHTMSLPNHVEDLLVEIHEREAITFAALSILELIYIIEERHVTLPPEYETHKASALEGCKHLLRLNFDQAVASKISQALELCGTDHPPIPSFLDTNIPSAT
jgi:hypothetical protein